MRIENQPYKWLARAMKDLTEFADVADIACVETASTKPAAPRGVSPPRFIRETGVLDGLACHVPVPRNIRTALQRRRGSGLKALRHGGNFHIDVHFAREELLASLGAILVLVLSTRLPARVAQGELAILTIPVKLGACVVLGSSFARGDLSTQDYTVWNEHSSQVPWPLTTDPPVCSRPSNWQGIEQP